MLGIEWLQGQQPVIGSVCFLCVLCADMHFGVFRVSDSQAACVGQWNIW